MNQITLTMTVAQKQILDCFPSDDEYDFDHLNQLLRKATDIESDEEDEEHDINDIDKVNDAFFE